MRAAAMQHAVFLLLVLTTNVHSFTTTSRSMRRTTLPTNAYSRIQPHRPAAVTTAVPAFIGSDVAFEIETAATTVLQQFSMVGGNERTILQTLPIVYAAGILTGFSPCVWGLLPVTIASIASAAGSSVLLPTLVFAAGLAVVFCTLGVSAVFVGGIFGASGVLLPLLSNAIGIVMGLKLLELVDVPLLDLSALRKDSTPELVLLDGTGQILPSGDDDRRGLFRTFVLGVSSALASSPCSTPVLTSILAYVTNTGGGAVGIAIPLLLCYTLGYSTPLLLVAAGSGQALVQLQSGVVGPWITPLTAGILLFYGTNGCLVTVFGDPSFAGLIVQ